METITTKKIVTKDATSTLFKNVEVISKHKTAISKVDMLCELFHNYSCTQIFEVLQQLRASKS